MKIVAGGIPLGENFYSGRQICVDQVEDFIGRGKDLLVLGPRRTGKTATIQEYIRQREEKQKDKTPSFLYVFLDLENCQSLYDFYLRIIIEILREAKKHLLIQNRAFEFIKEMSSKLSEIFPEGIDLSGSLGIPGGFPKIKFPKFDPKTIEKLNAELGKLLLTLERPLLIILDEFPELIWKFGIDLPEDQKLGQWKTQSQYLLNGLRTLRQEQGANYKKHQIIIAGSINLENTLRFLGLEASINDLERLHIPYLDPDQAMDLLNQLLKSEDISLDNDFDPKEFIKKQFGNCTPFYIQIFADKLRQKKIDYMGKKNLSWEDFQVSYKNLLMEPRGPEYLYTRIQRFYPKEKDQVVLLLEEIARYQFEHNRGIREEKLKEKLNLKNQREFTDLIIKMIADDLISNLGNGEEFGFPSQIICNFWNYRLVDGRFLK